MTTAIFIASWLLAGFLTWLFFLWLGWSEGSDVKLKEILFVFFFLCVGFIGPMLCLIVFLWCIVEDYADTVAIKGKKKD